MWRKTVLGKYLRWPMSPILSYYQEVSTENFVGKVLYSWVLVPCAFKILKHSRGRTSLRVTCNLSECKGLRRPSFFRTSWKKLNLRFGPRTVLGKKVHVCDRSSLTHGRCTNPSGSPHTPRPQSIVLRPRTSRESVLWHEGESRGRNEGKVLSDYKPRTTIIRWLYEFFPRLTG